MATATIKKNITELERLVSLIENSLTKEEFVNSFENIIKLILQIEKNLNTKNTETRRSLESLYGELSQKLLETNRKITDGLTTKVEGALKEQEIGMNFIYDKANKLKDSKDADESRIIERVLAQIKLPEFPKIEQKKPEQLRDELENLKDSERLRMDAIDGLKEELEKVKKEIKEMPRTSRWTGGWGRLGGFGGVPKRLTVTGTVNGTNDTFYIDGNYSFIQLYWNGALQEETIHYTKANKTITFTTGNIPTAGTLHGWGSK